MKITTLNSEKNALNAQMEATVAGKNKTITLITVLLVVAIIAAVVGFAKGRK